MSSIPKKIHYCWLGNNEKSELVQRCISSWKNVAPDYEIIEWNESNFPFEKCNQYVKEALEEKKWAFVTDYMRLWILYHEGGIYLDTDVELLKGLDCFLNHHSFMCSESLTTVCTAVIGARKGQEWIRLLLEKYDKRTFVLTNGKLDIMPNSQYIFKYFKEELGYNNNNKIEKLRFDLIMYPAEYFSPKNYSTMKLNITSNTYAIHHYGGMWKSPLVKIKDYILALITRIIGEKNREFLKRKLKS